VIVLSVSHVKKSFGTESVLKDVSLTLAQRERMGLVGVNGSGKTTLLRILAGQLNADEGAVAMQKGMVVGYLAQSYMPETGSTVLDEMEAIFTPIYQMEERLREIEELMGVSGEDALNKLGDEYAQLHARFEQADGYSCHSRVQGVLTGLGFGKDQQAQKAGLLSGGELTRLTLGRLLLQKPDLLLLDEPTNHLDLEALKWLEDYLNDYAGAVLLVSHDRYFLDSVCTGMTEILFGVSEQYRGNYTRYMEQRGERFTSRSRAYVAQQKEIERQQAIIARFRSYNREKSIRAAESREKALGRMDLLDRPAEERQVRFSFTAHGRMGDEVLKIFSDLNLLLHAGDRAALIGPNGIGKSTLLDCLTGQQCADSGSSRFGVNADIGYYDQKQQSLHEDKTVLREVWDDFSRLLQHEVRGALGLFLFTGEDVFKPVSALSGGERARVALTKLMLRHNNFLILDEPTNHLDSDSREVLEQALEGFDGTILAVSHDRYFINRFANKILVMSQDGFTAFDGNYDAYLKELARQRNPNYLMDQGKSRTEAVKDRRRARAQQEQYDALQLALREAEDEVSRAEAALQTLQDSLMDPLVYAYPEKAGQAAHGIKQQKALLNTKYLNWEQADETLRAFEAQERSAQADAEA
jgi:ATP-binding cassette subfamily F protein 3